MKVTGRPQRGVSLIEALVALALMGLGMLGVVAMQLSLRQNADIARQRSEALRIALVPIEAARSYSTVTVPPPGVVKESFDGLAVGTTTTAVNGLNASYSRVYSVAQSASQAAQNFKQVSVRVSWTDRTNLQQDVSLSTLVHRVPPEMGLSLAISGNGTVTQMPLGRHPSIPREARPGPTEGTSIFRPPGGGTLRWQFDNATGVITRICELVDGDLDCGPLVTGYLVSGFIAFDTGGGVPTPTDAETPPGDSRATSMNLTLSAPADVPRGPACFVEAPTEDNRISLAYFCAVFVNNASTAWTGQTTLAGLPLAPNIAETDDNKLRVCRYTPFRTNAATSGAVTIPNTAHPFTYRDVKVNLVNQNFLVIRAGDDHSAFDCPDDLASTTLVNGSTFRHQPSS